MVIYALSHLRSGRGAHKTYFRGQLGPCKTDGTRETPKLVPDFSCFQPSALCLVVLVFLPDTINVLLFNHNAAVSS